MRVLLATAVDPVSEVQNRYRPLWPAYLASMSRREIGADQICFKYSRYNPEEELERFKPDVFCVSSVTQNYSIAVKYARLAKKKGIPVVVGGMHVSALPSSLAPEFDIACIGEGEATFVDLLKVYLNEGSFRLHPMKDIPGLAFRDKGSIILTSDRPPISSLNDIPTPDRSLIGYQRRDYMSTARGCTHKCVFCICARYWGPVRYLSAGRILEEIEELIQNDVRIIRFNDDNFVANRKRLREIVEGIRSRNYHEKVKFSCWARADSITPEVVDLLKSMNIVAVVMGLESGSQTTLQYLKGNVRIEDNTKAIEILKEAGIQASGDFIIGVPGETGEDVKQTYHFIKNSRLDFVTINIFTPLPGTPVWEQGKKRGIVSDEMDWSRVNFKFNRHENRSVHMSDQFTHRELYRIYRKFQRLSHYRNLKALAKTPWIDELPLVAVKRIREKITGLAQGKNS